MQIEKHLSGLLTGIMVAGVCWLAFAVIFPPPSHAPVGTVKMYIPPKNLGQEYKPAKPLNEDESIIPNDTEKTNPPTTPGSTEYFGEKEDLKLPPTTVIPQEPEVQYPDTPKDPVPHLSSPEDGRTFYFGYDSGWEAPGATISPDAPKVADEFDDRIIPEEFKKKDTSHESLGIMEGQLATTCIEIGGCRVAVKRTFI